jgi:CheY-like chemotaxis protein
MFREADGLIDLPIPSDKDNETGKCFDLSVLIKQSDFNIRYAAEAHPLLTVGEYRERLEQFVGLAPDASDVIKKFAIQDFHLKKKDYKILEQMIKLLEGMMCDKFAVDFHFLKNAYRKKSNWELAAHHAELIADGFNGFQKRVKAAKCLDTNEGKNHEDTTLHDYIVGFDKENFSGKRIILAVDDSPDILKAIYSVLKNDYTVMTITNPLDLENTLKHVTPDLFLLDYRMPEINGFDLIPVIRKDEKHKTTPIIFLTAVGTIDHKSAAVMLGACDFLIKPLKADVLRETIALHISQ